MTAQASGQRPISTLLGPTEKGKVLVPAAACHAETIPEFNSFEQITYDIGPTKSAVNPQE